MPTYPMHFTDNAFSWRRLMMLWKLYWPELKIGFLVASLSVFAIVFLVATAAKITGTLSMSMLQFATGLMTLLSPIFLARRDFRDISSQLPVTALEKFSFLVIVFMIMFPAVVLLADFVGMVSATGIYGDEIREMFQREEQDYIEALGCGDFSLLRQWLLAMAWYVPIIAIVLYYVVSVKSNRVFAAIMSVVVVYIAIMFISGIISGYFGYKEASMAGSVDDLSEAAIADGVRQIMSTVVAIVTCLIEITGIIYLFKLYRHLRNSGF